MPILFLIYSQKASISIYLYLRYHLRISNQHIQKVRHHLEMRRIKKIFSHFSPRTAIDRLCRDKKAGHKAKCFSVIKQSNNLSSLLNLIFMCSERLRVWFFLLSSFFFFCFWTMSEETKHVCNIKFLYVSIRFFFVSLMINFFRPFTRMWCNDRLHLATLKFFCSHAVFCVLAFKSFDFLIHPIFSRVALWFGKYKILSFFSIIQHQKTSLEKKYVGKAEKDFFLLFCLHTKFSKGILKDLKG